MVNLIGLRYTEISGSHDEGMRVFPELIVMWGSQLMGETHPECGWHSRTCWGLGWNKGGRRKMPTDTTLILLEWVLGLLVPLAQT